MDKKRQEDILGIVKFFSELYMLKRNKRAGLSLLDAPPDSIAEHVALTAQIAYILAKMEGLNGEKCATIALFHDNNETRIGDLHRVALRYLEKEKASLKVIENQLRDLLREIKTEILKLVRLVETPERMILHDADWLELVLQAKILEEKGYKAT